MITCDDNHVYRMDGVIVPGVTQILHNAGLIDDRWFNDYATTRGDYVHQACALFDRNDLDETSLDPSIELYVRAWIKFRNESGFEPEAVEEIVFNPVYIYAGRLDRTGKINGQSYILDIKTGIPPKWAKWQLAAYAGCFEQPLKRATVELNAEGKYGLKEHTERNNFQEFLACLTVANMRKTND